MGAGLSSVLQQFAPASVLCVSAGAVPAVTRFREANPGLAVTSLHDTGALERSLGRFDLALVVNVLESMSKSDGTRLIANLRNFHSNAVAVALAAGQDKAQTSWSDTEFVALGLVPAGTDGSSRLYVYDIASYNDARVWNSPRHWANPENFRKFRW